MTLALAALEPTRANPARMRPADLGLGVLFERAQDAVIVARLTTCEIVLWNPAAQRLFGYTAEEAVGQSIEMLMPTAMGELHRAAVARYAQTGRGLIMDAPSPVEVPAVTRSRTDIRVQISLSEVCSRHGERFALAVMRDANHSKELELIRLELERVRRVSDVLLSALASATHDIQIDSQNHDSTGYDRLPLLRDRQNP